MNISEAIIKLEEIKKEHGDIECFSTHDALEFFPMCARSPIIRPFDVNMSQCLFLDKEEEIEKKWVVVL